MITKQQLIQLMSDFKKNVKKQYSLPIPTIIVTESTVEAAYFLIGRNSSDCKYYYDGVAYREDLYDVLVSFGLTRDDAYGIMQKVRKGIAQRINFDEFNISPALRDWCLGVRYLPSRKIVIDALENDLGGKNMEYYKDSDGINHRSAIVKNMKKLANIVCENNYDEILLPHPRKRYCHADEHIRCTLEPKNAKRVTEKRICRCWNYYNKNCHMIKCGVCEFEFKRTNVGDIKILDYEVPTVFSMENLGGIDWLLDDNGNTLATEVKPPESKETIVRMIAEILTYTIETSYTPAICFFKTTRKGYISKQCEDYMKFKDNDDFLAIKSKTGLRILYITFDDSTFTIHDAEKEPIE